MSSILSSVQSFSHVWLFTTPWAAAHQLSLSLTISWSLPKFMSNELVMPSNHLIFCHPLLLLLSIFPNISVISKQLVLPIRWPKYWNFSLSISPPNDFQKWFPLKWLVLSPCCPRDSQESSVTPQFKSINSLALSIPYGPTLTSIHDYCKNRSFDCMEICQ